MPIDDWAYLASRGGEAIESFIATLLRRKFSDAAQVTPASGDGGVDIFRRTAEGLIVYQVKKFVTPLSSSQWSQIERSWASFWQEHVLAGQAIGAYHLVTPWTPTQNRRADFTALTATAAFPTQWDGAAFIDGLADEFPETYARFAYGSGALERLVTAKAVLAASEPNTAEGLTFLDAINVREGKLDELRGLVSDAYYFDTGWRTMSTPGEWPLPPVGDKGVFYEFLAHGGNRFSYTAIVPRDERSRIVDPIRIEFACHVTPGSPEAGQLDEWKRWGVPFKAIPASVQHYGGPLAGSRRENVLIDFVGVQEQQQQPDMIMRVLTRHGTEKAVLKLRTDAVTQGAETGWLRLVARSSSGLLKVEIRNAPIADECSTWFEISSLDAASPSEVLTEIARLKTITNEDTIQVETSDGEILFIAGDCALPNIIEVAECVAHALNSLQASTNEVLLMPALDQVTDEQISYLRRVAAIYDGKPLRSTWHRQVVVLPQASEPIVECVKRGGPLSLAFTPQIILGNRRIVVERPLVRTYQTVHIGNNGHQPARGTDISIIPGADPAVVVAAVVDWKSNRAMEPDCEDADPGASDSTRT